MAARRWSTTSDSIPTKLAGAGLAVSDVENALGNNNGNAGGGFYSEGGQFYYVRGLGRVETTEDIGNIVVTVTERRPGADQGHRDASRSGTPRASASSASTTATTPWKA